VFFVLFLYRSRRSTPSKENLQNEHLHENDNHLALDNLYQYDEANCSVTITDLDDDNDGQSSSNCYSQYSNDSCSYCHFNPMQNVYNSIADDTEDHCSIDSINTRDFSRCDR